MQQPQPRSAVLPLPTRWLSAGATVAVCAIGVVAVAAPQQVARRLTAATLPPGADLAYARDLVQYVGLTGCVCVLALVCWWNLAPRFRVIDLGRWVLISTIALYAAAALSLWWYVDDDAGISFTFARNLAEGRGLTYNPGDPPVEGYSNPLWVALLAAARLMHLDILATSKVLGLVFGAACLLVMWPAVRALHPIAWLALPIAALNASAVVWSSSGLENALHALLVTATVVLLPAAEGRGRARRMLLLVLCALALSRPEGLVFALAAAAYLLLRAWRRGAALLPAAGVLLAPMLVYALLMVFRLAYFGDLMPNTYYAKASSSNPLRLLNPASGGWSYVAAAVSGCGWTLGLAPILVVLASPRRSATASAALMIVTAQIFFVVSVSGDWMKEFRFIAPIVPAVSLLIGEGLAQIAGLSRASGFSARRLALTCAPLAAFMVFPQMQRLIVFAHDPTTPLATVASVGQYFKELGARAGLEDPLLLHHDAGGTSYVANIRVLDLAGLCDRTIAREWRDRERMRQYIFEERRPEFIYSGPYFAQRIDLEEFPEFEADYVPLPPAPRPELDGYIRCVRRDIYERLFGEAPNPSDLAASTPKDRQS